MRRNALVSKNSLQSLMLLFLTLTINTNDCSGDDFDLARKRTIKAAVKTVSSSMVQITTIGGAESLGGNVSTSSTTGTVVDREGHIVSSSFNFAQKPTAIIVSTPDGKKQNAKIISRDHIRNIVLLKIEDGSKLNPISAAEKSKIRIGETVVALGKVYSIADPNLSAGIVSATNRVWNRAVQTDAKISPANYGGPLINLRGEGVGVLVPLSPRGNGVAVGAEWYDSGIGFAIPIQDVLGNLQTMKEGNDIYPGLLGIQQKSGNIYVEKASVLGCPKNSPAYQSGIRVGDLIESVNGQAIRRQSELKHALGSLAAGQTVSVGVRRDDKSLKFQVQLAKEILPFEPGFLGVLPARKIKPQADQDNESGTDGVGVRMVFKESPAAKVGIRRGDFISRINGRKVKSQKELREMLADFQSNQKLEIEILRGEKKISNSLTLGEFSTTIPNELPLPILGDKVLLGSDQPIETGVVELKVLTEKNRAFVVVPKNYTSSLNHGLLVLLSPPQRAQPEQIEKQWQSYCDANRLIVLVVEPKDLKRWSPVEADFVRKATDQIVRDYVVDTNRICLVGDKTGGALGTLVAFANRDLYRGLVVIDSAKPTRLEFPSYDPFRPLSVLWVSSVREMDQAIEKDLNRLRELKYPLALRKIDSRVDLQKSALLGLKNAQLEEVLRWLDSLDRI